jgi:hypothetical protein
MRLIVELSAIDGLEDGEKLFIQTNPIKQVRIIDTSMSKLLMVEGLILLPLLSGVDGDAAPSVVSGTSSYAR